MDTKTAKYAVLINANAGTARKTGLDTLQALITRTLGDRLDTLVFATGQDIASQLQTMIASPVDAILIGGGDGTINKCGAACYESGKPFGIIPLGTMNLLARDLGLPDDLEQCLQSYRQAAITKIDVATVNDRPFFCNTVIGIVPEAALERENARNTPSISSWGNLASTVIDGLNNDHFEKLKIKMKGRFYSVTAKSFVIANNSYSEYLQSPENRLTRDTLQDGTLAVYIARPRTPFQAMKLLYKVIAGGWPKDPIVKSFRTKELTLKKKEENTGRTVLASLDGEPVEIASPLKFDIHPLAAQILTPTERKAA